MVLAISTFGFILVLSFKNKLGQLKNSAHNSIKLKIVCWHSLNI